MAYGGGGRPGWLTDPVSGRRMPGQASVRVGAAAVLGLVAAVATGVAVDWDYAVAAGFDAAAVLFLAWTWAAIRGMDAAGTAAHATREDPTARTTRLIVLAASVASLVGIGYLLVQASSAQGVERAAVAALGVGSVAISWVVVHTLFTLHYALLYYGAAGPDGTGGGIEFPQPPRYADFAYLAFTIGMTYQLSDTPVTTGPVRATVLRHALLSYLFGALILAATVNLVSSLASTAR